MDAIILWGPFLFIKNKEPEPSDGISFQFWKFIKQKKHPEIFRGAFLFFGGYFSEITGILSRSVPTAGGQAQVES